jgi:competence protein ComEA
MPTTAESRALAFFAGLFAFGAAVRFAAHFRHPDPEPSAASAEALARQLGAVDSAAKAGGSRGRKPSARRPKGGGAPDTVVAAPLGVAPELAAAAGWFARPAPKRAPDVAAASSGVRTAQEQTVAPVDLDTADEAAVEALPGIGPSLARRIVADRAANGAFGSMDGLGRVKGVGAVLRARLATRVTFSGAGRHP